MSTTDKAGRERARLSGLGDALDRVVPALEKHQGQERHDTTPWWAADWRDILDRPLPETGTDAEEVLDVLAETVIPHSVASDAAGFTGWIFSSPPVVPAVARLVAARVGSQRYLGFATNLCEEVALRWTRELFGIPAHHAGVFTSGGSAANLVALAVARQELGERHGVDVGQDGLAGLPPVRVYASDEVHHCLHKNAGILGLGRRAVRTVPVDDAHRIDVAALREAMTEDIAAGMQPLAVVASAGTVNTGAVDPIDALADVCAEHGTWLHVDGAYGLPGVLDDRVAHLFAGLERADSVVTDLHKWPAAPTGVGVVYVRDEGLLFRSFTAEPAAYIEGQFSPSRDDARSAWEWMGTPYADWSVELTAPAQGVVVWALLAELGRAGLADRVRRHIDLARLVADEADAHPRLEALHRPDLSIACFRYVGDRVAADRLDALNAEVLTRLRRGGSSIPSATTIGGRFAIRPCFLTPWNDEAGARRLLADVVAAGDALTRG